MKITMQRRLYLGLTAMAIALGITTSAIVEAPKAPKLTPRQSTAFVAFVLLGWAGMIGARSPYYTKED